MEKTNLLGVHAKKPLSLSQKSVEIGFIHPDSRPHHFNLDRVRPRRTHQHAVLTDEIERVFISSSARTLSFLS